MFVILFSIDEKSIQKNGREVIHKCVLFSTKVTLNYKRNSLRSDSLFAQRHFNGLLLILVAMAFLAEADTICFCLHIKFSAHFENFNLNKGFASYASPPPMSVFTLVYILNLVRIS